MAKLTINLLGGFEVLANASQPLELPIRKARALLILLALNAGRKLSREAATNLLWGDRPQKHANASLSQALYSLRKSFGRFHPDALEADKEYLLLDCGAVQVDALRFSELVGRPDFANLTAGVALYRGAFLDGFVAPTAEFEEWMQTERRRLHAEAVEALAILLQTAVERGDGAAGKETARKLLQIDPYNEAAVRVLMQCHASCAQIGLATTVFEDLRQRLADELNAEPEPDTAKLHERILRREIVAAPDAPISAAAPLQRRRVRLGPRMVAGIAVIGLVAIAGAGWWHPWVPAEKSVDEARTELALPARPSIAVLAFEDHSAGRDKGYLSDAIAEGIITELSRFSELFVIARNSSFHYRDKATDVRDIARELGVRYILEGSQQKVGSRLRVNLQLIDAIDGKNLWATTYDRDLADIFRVQDEIAASVASTLGEKLTTIASEDTKRAGPAELSAFEQWIRGRRYFNRFTRDGSEQARLAYSAAIEADPKLALGYSGMAWVYINGYRWGWTELERVDALSRAREAAQKALDLAPYDYVPHFTMAAVHMQAGEREKAEAEFERALELNPNSGDVMANFAELLGYEGRFRESIHLLRRAMRLDPHHPEWFRWNLGWAQYSLGDCRDGLATMRKMSRIPPLANRTLAAIYACLGEPDRARAAISALLDHDPDYSIAKFRLNFKGKYRDPAYLEGWIEDLRLAGLPE